MECDHSVVLQAVAVVAQEGCECMTSAPASRFSLLGVSLPVSFPFLAAFASLVMLAPLGLWTGLLVGDMGTVLYVWEKSILPW